MVGIKTFAALLGAVMFFSYFPAVDAEEWSPNLPQKITLLHETKLYAEASESSASWATLSPQDVQTAGAEKDWYRPMFGEQKWVKIHTSWMGDQWVHIDWHEIGWLVPKDEFADVSGEMPLYNEPEYGYTGATITSQIVHMKGIFYRPMQMPAYLVESWIGDKWFTPSNVMVIEGVIPTEEKVNIEGEGSFFDNPSNQPLFKYNTTTFKPQEFTSTARYGDFYKVKTETGQYAWVSPRFSQPAVTTPVSEDIVLTEKTAIYSYPNLQSFLDPLAAQTVHANAKVQDIWENTWYRISTWLGDAWIIRNNNGGINPSTHIATDTDGYIQVFPKVISGNSHTVSGRLYVANMPRYIDYNDLSFTLEMIDEKGNVLTNGEGFIPGVRQNDEVAFTVVLGQVDASVKNFSFRVSEVQFHNPL
ncbi:hypothetical protein HQN90_35810 [Paenibacillus alba]|uniref:hypothetical protein n=1 Tax=Paenibacillus alba TaxID=1197127 RepID=UPI001567B46A|nr:hypothetical protein [Paenibacillus alba]NQX71465.1 hypothetical protein [Paenibacillus alba]